MIRAVAAGVGLTAAATAGWLTAATPTASAQNQIRVGVVVDYGESGGPGVHQFCAMLPPRSTGAQALSYGASVTYRSDGLVCTINGYPTDGCAAVTAHHFWSYWHRKPGASGWSYATTGPASYRPVDGEVEGWSWHSTDGPNNDDPPPLRRFDSVCPTAASPKPTPKPTTASPAPAPTRSAGFAPTAAASRSSQPSTTASSSPASTTASVAPSPVVTTGNAATTSAGVVEVATPTDDDGGLPVGSLVGAAGIAALLGAAALRFRRRQP